MTLASASSTSASRKYAIRTALFMGGYVAVNVAAISGAFDTLKAPGTWAFALVVSAPVVGQIWALLTWMKQSDEFVRAVTAKCFIVGAGLAMAVASAWGFLELYAKVPHVSAALLFPLFWAFFGLASIFIRTSH